MCNTPSTRAPRQSCCTPGKCVPSISHWNWLTKMDRQAGLFIARECTRVLGMVHQDGLELAVSHQVSPQQEGCAFNSLQTE